VGFLGGVLTKVIPYEECQFVSAGAPVPDYCRLRYTPETATLSGSVRDSGCRGGPLDSARVRLREMDRDPARIRTAFSTRAGEFLIGALEPGIPHFLEAQAAPVIVNGEPIEAYGTYTDTLTFLPGQRVAHDIRLVRLAPCDQFSTAQ
jgi:hypothetical protein